MNRRGTGSGGHYVRAADIRILQDTVPADRNGVRKAKIELHDKATSAWKAKDAESSFFPAQWSRRQIALEIKAAFRARTMLSTSKWQGVSPSGITMEGRMGSNGKIITAYPKHQDAK